MAPQPLMVDRLGMITLTPQGDFGYEQPHERWTEVWMIGCASLQL
jgi:hypothetical protein